MGLAGESLQDQRIIITKSSRHFGAFLLPLHHIRTALKSTKSPGLLKNSTVRHMYTSMHDMELTWSAWM